MSAGRRLRECVESWPECFTGGYDPRCCRFPKSCSASVYGDGTDESLLEPVRVEASESEAARGVRDKPTVTYDRTANAVYISVRDGEVARTVPVPVTCNIDHDAAGQVLGMEILGPTDPFAALLRRLGLEDE